MIKEALMFQNKCSIFGPDKLFPPELYRVYFPVHIVRCVYNLTKDEAGTAMQRLKNNPQMPYEDILKDMPNAMFGDEGEILTEIKQ